MSEKYNPVKLLKENNTIQIPPTGYSMYPFINPANKDQVIIEPIGSHILKRGDVVLYRRKFDPVTKAVDNRLILHRIYSIKNTSCYMVGDNQTMIEGPIDIANIYGIMTAIIKKGKTTPISNPLYRIESGIWLFLRPFRKVLGRIVAFVKRPFK